MRPSYYTVCTCIFRSCTYCVQVLYLRLINRSMYFDFAGFETVFTIGEVMDAIEKQTCIRFMTVNLGLSSPLSKTRSAISFDTIGGR